jgi:hypothetical protein
MLTQCRSRKVVSITSRPASTAVLLWAVALSLAACAPHEESTSWDPSVYGSPGVRTGPDFFDPQFYGGIGI